MHSPAAAELAVDEPASDSLSARCSPPRTSQHMNSFSPEGLNFSMNQSGIDFKCRYSNRPLKPLARLIGLWHRVC
jgi:hypothetical protein